jgi:hypothetical protein
LAECKAWLAARGKRPTVSKPKKDDVDVTDVMATAGLREVG